MTWWLVIRTPDGVYCWPVWGEHEEPNETLINAARVAAGFPAHDAWVLDGSGFSVQLTLGEPHPTLMERAKVGTAGHLAKVDRAKVQAHKDGRELAARQARIDAAKDVLAALDPAELRSLRAHLPQLFIDANSFLAERSRG